MAHALHPLQIVPASTVAATLPHADPVWLRRLLAATLVFNLVDAVLTLLVVSLGAAEEANPLMAAALNASPLAFMALKLGLVSAGILFLWSKRSLKIAHVGGFAVFLVYAGVVAWHVQSVEVIAALVQTVA